MATDATTFIKCHMSLKTAKMTKTNLRRQAYDISVNNNKCCGILHRAYSLMPLMVGINKKNHVRRLYSYTQIKTLTLKGEQ